MSRAIYAGSFDPFTLGHKNIVDQGLEDFENIIIVIAKNPDKTGLFSIKEREEIINTYFKNNQQVQVKILENEFLASYAKREGVENLIRGVRNQHDKEYEKNIAAVNKTINPNIKTKFYRAEKSLAHVSSSLVKSVINLPEGQRVALSMVKEEVVSFFLEKRAKEFLNKKWKKISKNNNWFNFILKKHIEHHRHYHNVNHLIELFLQFEKMENEVKFSKKDKKIIFYCIFFHDLIYDPLSKNNEEDSADLWLLYCQENNINKKIEKKVYETILSTKNHSQELRYPISKYFVDLDLSILGSDPIKYFYYEKAIREEYKLIPEEIYNVERKKVMSKLVSPFKTDWGREKFQKKCQENLALYSK